MLNFFLFLIKLILKFFRHPITHTKKVVRVIKHKIRSKIPMLNYASELVKAAEGFRSTTYLDTLGNPTIGYGFNLNDGYINKLIEKLFDIKEVKRLTEQQSDEIVKVLLEGLNKDMQSYDWYNECSVYRKAAILDMAYNMGIPTLLTFNNAIECMKKKDYTLASENFMNSLWSKQVGNRAKRDCYIIEFNKINERI